jgi:hypothetical protein
MIYFFIYPLVDPSPLTKLFNDPSVLLLEDDVLGWSEMTYLPLIQIIVGILLTCIPVSCFALTYRYFFTTHFESHIVEEDEREIAISFQPLFRKYLILFFVFWPLFLTGGLCSIFLNPDFQLKTKRYQPTWWIGLDVTIHTVSFIYCMASVTMSCAVFCMVQEMLCNRIRLYAMQLMSKNASIKDLFQQFIGMSI